MLLSPATGTATRHRRSSSATSTTSTATPPPLKDQAQRDQERARAGLPILQSKEEFTRRLQEEKVLVVTAATGSGKTTQLPQYCAEAFDGGLVVCTQPRLVAATSIARRVAEEYDGNSVGYSVGYVVGGGGKARGDKILFMTDAALVKESQKDAQLRHVRVLIIDEAHERNLNTDLVIGIAKLLRQR